MKYIWKKEEEEIKLLNRYKDREYAYKKNKRSTNKFRKIKKNATIQYK